MPIAEKAHDEAIYHLVLAYQDPTNLLPKAGQLGVYITHVGFDVGDGGTTIHERIPEDRGKKEPQAQQSMSDGVSLTAEIA